MHIDDRCTNQSQQIAIALGSNLGDSVAILTQAFAYLTGNYGLKLICHSHWYQTPPLGPPQPDFINGCAVLEMTHSPGDLLQILLATERHFGRFRRGKWQARTLDLDMIFYGHEMLNTPDLTIPHPEYHHRAFVLVPLAEIAPDWRDPHTGLTVRILAQKADRSGIMIIRDS
ncbi:2-amino-4-hydroxy-6-hydroxymethyldihydropteridine pyrophosphokinase [Gloeomargarita lithophora Alchichica-D10]|uniref:2-amino-4-hydroxy-6-hydroxymethyldihydropteridine diphosphokinase n=1 Tax=Gloeomargarita lithophora Alchichica-D10 TaxID=1188229 RepID=A0A1J0AGN3_9CYAN|nr:2-amino-4-hydroxy-6-hydroxymethyldihydropteridine diphosphokinase [Gloeomargarita lithophora]APB35094.1 2-amino-4-hydroxy-6-hydroxymethyldihydropteridine pyrophosphokinase [Gloeomargarita lithophora Alchichica-D10]